MESIEKKVETGLQISTSEGVPTTEARLTCYIHYYPGGVPPLPGSKKHVFPVLINGVWPNEKKSEKLKKVLRGFFIFRRIREMRLLKINFLYIIHCNKSSHFSSCFFISYFDTVGYLEGVRFTRNATIRMHIVITVFRRSRGYPFRAGGT